MTMDKLLSKESSQFNPSVIDKSPKQIVGKKIKKGGNRKPRMPKFDTQLPSRLENEYVTDLKKVKQNLMYRFLN